MLAGASPSDEAMLGSERHHKDDDSGVAQMMLRAPMPVCVGIALPHIMSVLLRCTADPKVDVRASCSVTRLNKIVCCLPTDNKILYCNELFASLYGKSYFIPTS